MKIDKLKIAGFKSFADGVEIPVGNGITGIVGPNGCGKSNLIEALRWAMGETSAKRMRADGMDDVIFGGTDTRPPRASCEVTISIDNSSRLAPAEFNSYDRLDVSRRIDRGEGSSYKVNGKQARARDVQVLFKDAGVGAGSSALVSQGKVGAIINSKPSERRNILEEAAGVAGLASRRHEAELRLRGTEQNLERAEDMERGLSEQLSSLRRQARQAKRRKDIDGLVRAAEATSFLVRWRGADAKVRAGTISHDENEAAVAAAIIELNKANTDLSAAEAAAAPSAKAKMDCETAFALAKARIDGVRKEIQAAKAALANARKSVDRTKSDIDREKLTIGSSGEEFEDLRDRKAIAEDDREYDAVLLEEASASAGEAKDRLDELTERVQIMAEALAGARAERQAVERRKADAKQRLDASLARMEAAKKRVSEMTAELGSLPEPDGLVVRLEGQIADVDAGLADAMTDLEVAMDGEVAAKTAKNDADTALAVTKSEMSALKSLTEEIETAGSRTVAAPGYEIAAATAFGEGLSAALGTGESRWWVGSKSRLSPPEATTPLSEFVEVPSELSSALSGMGVVDSDDQLDIMAERLEPGQMVVSRQGYLVRWDGYRAKGAAGAAETIRRTARLRQLETDEIALVEGVSRAANALATAVSDLAAARSIVDRLRARQKELHVELTKARAEREGAEKRRSELNASILAANEALASLSESLATEEASKDEAESALEKLPDIVKEEMILDEGRREASIAKTTYEKAREALDKVKRDAEARLLLLQNIAQQMADFDKRLVAAREHVLDLEGRLAEASQEVERLVEVSSRGPELEAEAIEEVETAALALAEENAAAKESDELLSASRLNAKSAEAKLAAGREDRARLLAELKAAQEASRELAREITERLACQPDELSMIAGVEPDTELPDVASCDARVHRLTRERDSIGVVNLLAEEQVAEVEAKLGETNKTRADLREAVKRLRSTIAEFDREARERLTEAFALIDGHFRDLFSRLFGGGHAYLKLSGSEDILDAGLEIYASPPGKKLQTMSLLSGGEQALAALALIFAAFLIRPAPVCVLDEVDAPLDDANVDRLCSLVSDMAKESTRFLVVTHHALTMARCDRLFGVTMMERGVSRLAAVDMNAAVSLVEAG